MKHCTEKFWQVGFLWNPHSGTDFDIHFTSEHQDVSLLVILIPITTSTVGATIIRTPRVFPCKRVMQN